MYAMEVIQCMLTIIYYPHPPAPVRPQPDWKTTHVIPTYNNGLKVKNEYIF